MDFDRRLFRSFRGLLIVNRNLLFDFNNASGSYTGLAVHDTVKRSFIEKCNESEWRSAPAQPFSLYRRFLRCRK
jgi:hypothetical protein